jgi:hypothetical protein
LQLAGLYLIPIANEACSKSPSSHHYYTVGVTLFSTGISEECPRLAAVACEKVNRVREGGSVGYRAVGHSLWTMTVYLID